MSTATSTAPTTSPLSRAAALFLAGIALATFWSALDRQDLTSDLGALSVSAAAGCALVAVAVWRANGFAARLVAVLLSIATVIGQLLVAVVGLPENPNPHWTSIGLVFAALALGVLVLIGADARSRAGTVKAVPPYAL